MNFFKPKFWDKNKISFFSVLLFPVSLLIKVLNPFKRFLIKTNQSSIPIICVGNIYLSFLPGITMDIEEIILSNSTMNKKLIKKNIFASSKFSFINNNKDYLSFSH